MSNSYWMKIDHFPALQCFETSVSILLICALFSRPSLGLDKDTPLLCSQKGHTMRVEAQICVPTGSTSGEEFTKASVDNCNKLKDGCQEFNEATCIWFEQSIKGKTFQFPVCRLMYYTQSFMFFGPERPWIELFFVNQFGTFESNLTLFTILELHRRITRQDFFPFESPDYPENVADPNSVQGLKWTSFNSPHPLTIDSSLLCKGGVDNPKYCNLNITKMFKEAYKTGALGEYKGDKFSATGSCGKYLIEGLKTDVCRVTFETWVQKPHSTVTQIVLEAQAYAKKDSVAYRYAVMGGNSILPNGSLVPDNRKL
uniref:Uncharacterized protein n=2 Tax=Cacopsylla melanoneura TaxID=428564 RepID=A0A8D8M4L0_9HEMI